LQFVNGFKVEDSRQNIYWGSKPNTLIYPAAAVGIVMDATNLKQKFMGAGNTKTANGHTDDITCLSVDPQKKLVLTGSLGAQPLILLWDSDTMEIKGRTKLARNTRAVATIRFSKDGKLFFCSDKHNDSNVYVYDVSSMSLRGQNKSGSDVIVDA
jgi:WD40 repeat protein